MATSKTPKDPNAPKKWPTSDYETGYARPPKHGQIRPGEVRNKWGPKGKPKPERRDAFEFAASMLTSVVIDGKSLEVTAEEASHLVNLRQAMAGTVGAHKIVAEERRSRRQLGPPAPTAEELLKEQENDEKKKELSAEIVRGMGLYSWMSKQRMLIKRDARIHLAPWLEEAMGDYRLKHGKTAERAPGEDWNPHPAIPPGPDDWHD